MLLLAGFTYAGETGFRARRLLAAAALAYLLACFWLTPRFIMTTLFNWPADAFNYKLKLAQWLLGALLVVSTAALWTALVRLPVSIYLRYAVVCCWGFLFVVSWHYWTLVDVIPESRRYAPEMEIFLLAAWLEAARLLLADGRRLARDAAFALLGVGLVAAPAQAAQYLVVPWWRLQPVPREQTVEYCVAGWLAAREPRGRVMVSGGTRFRLNAWYALPQVGGTFESGLRNRTPVYWIDHLRWGVGSQPGRRGADSILALRMAGAEYIAVHAPGSREHFRDVRQPEQFRGLLPVVYEAGDDVIYRLPFTGLAHLVRAEEMPAVRPVESEIRRAEPYVNALDDTARPRLETEWEGASRLRIRGPVPPGMLVSAMVSYDGGWRATQDGQPLAVGHDAMDYILLRPRPAAATHITLEYHPTREHIAMTALSALAWLAALLGWWLPRWRR
jgi:hypothetical protein